MTGDWSFELSGAPTTGVLKRYLTEATGRQVTFRLDGAADAQFALDGRSEEASEIVSLATDLIIREDGTKRFRGRIGSQSHQISPDRHTVTFTALDYRAMLNKRQIGPAGRRFAAGTAQGLIAWTLIAESEAQPGAWGYTRGLGSSASFPREATYNPGDKLGDKIAELGRLDNGFEWQVSPDLALDLWFPRRGVTTTEVLDYGGVISSLQRHVDPDDFANVTMATGESTLTPAVQTSTTINTDLRGRWETSQSFPGVVIPAHLASKATWLLAATNRLRPECSVELTPDVWRGPSHFWLGDTVTLQIIDGMLNERTAQRVAEMRLNWSEDGDLTVNVGLLPL